MSISRFLIALGSNQRHVRFGSPSAVLDAALQTIQNDGITIRSSAPYMASRPIGPSKRSYANGAAIIETDLTPEKLLRKLKKIERKFGKRRGQPWSRRTLDLDIILWSEGIYSSEFPSLIIPHPRFRKRHFVLRPARAIAAHWRDPISGLSLAQLACRLNHPKPLDRRALPH